jgi:hypothetical protein
MLITLFSITMIHSVFGGATQAARHELVLQHMAFWGFLGHKIVINLTDGFSVYSNR